MNGFIFIACCPPFFSLLVCEGQCQDLSDKDDAFRKNYLFRVALKKNPLCTTSAVIITFREALLDWKHFCVTQILRFLNEFTYFRVGMSNISPGGPNQPSKDGSTGGL